MSIRSPFRIRLIALPAVLALSACAGNVPRNDYPDAEIDAMIAEAVAETAAANRSIAAIEKNTARYYGEPGTEIMPSPPHSDSNDPMLIDWNGPVEPLLQILADRAGYRFVMTGRRPVNAAQISIAGEFQSPEAAIKSINAAAYGHANITADASRGVITLEYPR